MIYTVDSAALRKAMIDNNMLTIDTLSNESGVNRNTISAILDNKSRPSSSVIDKLALALRLDGNDIGRIFFVPKLAYKQDV